MNDNRKERGQRYQIEEVDDQAMDLLEIEMVFQGRVPRQNFDPLGCRIIRCRSKLDSTSINRSLTIPRVIHINHFILGHHDANLTTIV